MTSICRAASPSSPAPRAASARSSRACSPRPAPASRWPARRVERLKSLRAEIEAEGGDAHVVPLDVTDHDGIKAAVAHAETESARSTSWSTTPASATTQKLVDVTPEDFDYVFDVNVRGAFFVAQEVGKRMIARAQGAAPGTFIGGPHRQHRLDGRAARARPRSASMR